MQPQSYTSLSSADLMALCVWRESQDQPIDGQRGVAHVISNRASQPGWWGRDIQTVVLHPWQFSSFNEHDPNSSKWPGDNDPAWEQCLDISIAVLNGSDADLTEGATYYHDTSMGWPSAWGNISEYENTLNVGRLKFYRMVPVPMHPDLSSET